MQEPQNYKNHAKFFPLFHFVLAPILFLNLIWQSVRLYQEPSWDRAVFLVLSFVFILITLSARLQALTAQDRLIKLEEKLRYREILPKELADKASSLKTGQIIALRFASDNELPDLLNRVLNGELTTPKEIKLAVKDWKGDYLRV